MHRHDESYRDGRGEHRRSAGGDKGKGYADDRSHAHDHADVQKALYKEIGEDSDTDVPPEAVARAEAVPENP